MHYLYHHLVSLALQSLIGGNGQLRYLFHFNYFSCLHVLQILISDTESMKQSLKRSVYLRLCVLWPWWNGRRHIRFRFTMILCCQSLESKKVSKVSFKTITCLSFVTKDDLTCVGVACGGRGGAYVLSPISGRWVCVKPVWKSKILL